LTRVTRIFQKSVFTKTTPRRPGGTPRRAFCCTDAESARARRISSLQTRRETMTFHKGESGNPAGRPRGSLNRTTVLMQSLLEAADIAKAVDIYVRALATQQFEERLAKLERGPAPAGAPANADA